MNRKKPLLETFTRIGGKSSLDEKKDVIWTWTELSDAFWDMGMDTRKISTMRQKLKKYTGK